MRIEGPGPFASRSNAPDAATLLVRDSVFRNNKDAVDEEASGVFINAGLRTEIADSRADRNDFGFVFDSGARGGITGSVAMRNSREGLRFQLGTVFAVSESVADGNGIWGVFVSGSGTQVTLTGMVLSTNGSGDVPGSGGLAVAGPGAVARIGGSTVTSNFIGLVQVPGATLETFGDNLVRGNSVFDTGGTITTVAKT